MRAEREQELYDAGFVGAANDDTQLTVTLLWSGESPLQQVVREEGARRGIAVEVWPVRFSDAELRAGVERIFAARNRFAEAGFAVHGIAG
ncbi:MAG TPA: hypothetical protein VFH94_05395, partial [Streptomyces sp.]|nr:hypothetical protein [Streptomyces sp.]